MLCGNCLAVFSTRPAPSPTATVSSKESAHVGQDRPVDTWDRTASRCAQTGVSQGSAWQKSSPWGWGPGWLRRRAGVVQPDVRTRKPPVPSRFSTAPGAGGPRLTPPVTAWNTRRFPLWRLPAGLRTCRRARDRCAKLGSFVPSGMRRAGVCLVAASGGLRGDSARQIPDSIPVKGGLEAGFKTVSWCIRRGASLGKMSESGGVSHR